MMKTMRFKARLLGAILGLSCLPIVQLSHAQCGTPGSGNCCQSNPTKWCDDAECCATVCAIEPFCCNVGWSSGCAGLAKSLCHDLCGDCGTGTQFGQPCCTAKDTPYCYNAPCCESVCAELPHCCETAWDQECVDLAWQLCPDLPGCTPPSCVGFCGVQTPNGCWCDEQCCVQGNCCPDKMDVCGGCGTGPCCELNPTPGCVSGACTEAVCAVDPFCCDTSGAGWDQCCADLALVHCAEPAEPPSGTCCDWKTTGPGCSDPVCQDAVCKSDPFCCNSTWDSWCTEMAVLNPSCDCEVAPCRHNTTCIGNCGERFYSGCSCDDACCVRGDCCLDLKGCGWACDPAFESCAGVTCGHWSFGCQCNSSCTLGVDCCPDICQHCGHPGCNPADLTGDNTVGVADLLILLQSWGRCPPNKDCPSLPGDCPADFDEDGSIGVGDLLILLAQWG